MSPVGRMGLKSGSFPASLPRVWAWLTVMPPVYLCLWGWNMAVSRRRHNGPEWGFSLLGPLQDLLLPVISSGPPALGLLP